MMQAMRSWVFGIGLLVSAAAGACSDNPYAPREAGADPLPSEDYPQVSALEKLHKVIVVSDVKEDAGPPLKITAAVRNRANDDERDVQYRFFFLDKDGRPENAQPDWRYVHMPARTLVYMTGNALDVGATSWRLEIRPAR
jgi:uncharacterized protein YcfL